MSYKVKKENKVGHLLSELGFDLETSDTLLITLLSKIRQRKFDTTIPTVDDQPYCIRNNW